jgi:methionyl-tRNA formyltransferase
MGTPDFAVPPLEALLDSGHEVIMTATRPDRPRDRGKKLQSPPVKKLSEERGIPVLQPETLRGNSGFLDALRLAEPDLIVVAAYGGMLPAEILALPKLGCVNIHASLLPAYRGAAPIQRAILDGAEKTGASLMYMAEKMDAGDVIASVETVVGRKTATELSEELSRLGAVLLTDSLPAIESGRAVAAPQDESRATYAPMLRKEEGRVDFRKSPEETERLTRGLNPWPGARFMYGNTLIKLWEAVASDQPCDLPPGTVVSASEEGIAVSAGGRTVLFTKVQPPGRKAMKVPDFLRGNNMEPGIVLY